jgi:hypothetical protein
MVVMPSLVAQAFLVDCKVKRKSVQKGMDYSFLKLARLHSTDASFPFPSTILTLKTRSAVDASADAH